MEALIATLAVIMIVVFLISWVIEWISSNSDSIIQIFTAVFIFGLAIFILKSEIARNEKRAKDRLDELNQQKRNEEEKKQREKIRLENEARKKAEIYGSLIDIRQEALSFLSNGPAKLKGAEEFLENALSDFEDRAFYPFWDNIEKATLSIHDFNSRLEKLSQDAVNYPNKSREIDTPVPKFPVTRELVEKLPISLETVDRIRKVERLAHRDFEFSSIYATRKTNNILISGFQNLSDALSSINSSMEVIIDQLDSGFDAVVRAQDRTTKSTILAGELISNQIEELRESAAKYHEQSINEISEINARNRESAERERFAIQALDNIQRKRKPLDDWKIFGNVRGMKDPESL